MHDHSLKYPMLLCVLKQHSCIVATQQATHPPSSPLSSHLAAAGKDYRDSVLKDARSSLIVFAGGDPDLRQAVTDGKVQQVRHAAA
jgi:hypothetical protein